MNQILTKEKVKRDCIRYIASNSLKQVSYMDLFMYLTVKKGIGLPHGGQAPHNHDLLIVLSEIADFTPSEYTAHNINFNIPQHLSVADKATLQEDIDKKLNEYQTDVLTKKRNVKDTVYDNYDDELRLEKTEEDSQRSLKISIWSFGIAIAALIITGIQLSVDYWDIHYGKDYKFEKATMHSDSIQIIQNQKMIELLEKQNHSLDSIRKKNSIVHQKKSLAHRNK